MLAAFARVTLHASVAITSSTSLRRGCSATARLTRSSASISGRVQPAVSRRGPERRAGRSRGLAPRAGAVFWLSLIVGRSRDPAFGGDREHSRAGAFSAAGLARRRGRRRVTARDCYSVRPPSTLITWPVM